MSSLSELPYQQESLLAHEAFLFFSFLFSGCDGAQVFFTGMSVFRPDRALFFPSFFPHPF